jgi:hypothetical protein
MLLLNLKHVLTNLSVSKSKLIVIKPKFLAKQFHASNRLHDSKENPKDILNSSLTETKEKTHQQISTHVSLGAKGFWNV